MVNNMKIDMMYNGISIKVNIDNELNILAGNSGTGKTLLMKAVQLHCLKNKIKHIYCDSDCISLSEEQIASICSDKEVVLLDNADLYLNNELLTKIRSNIDKTIIICMKDTSELNIHTASEYIVKYKDKSLTVREI